jgi:hypothetical protein
MKKTTRTNSTNPQPVHKIRHGAVSASIWRNDTNNGPMFNVTFQRAYKEGDLWKNSGSFGRKDLLVLGLIAARSFEWIGAQAKNGKQPPPKNEDDVPY